MTRTLTFAKAESLRNDFILIDGSRRPVRLSPARARAICDRRSGIGADGVIVLGTTSDGVTPYRMLNSDGSDAEWSGNGVRCAAAWLARRSESATVKTLRTRAGDIPVTLGRRVRSGRDATFAGQWPSIDGVHRRKFRVGRRAVRPWVVDAGNPHWVWIVPNFDFDWEECGRLAQEATKPTHGTNVEFVVVHARSHLKLRLFERGVGPTPSSGTGALAAVAVCHAEGLIDRRLRVEAAGGTQHAVCDRESRLIHLRAHTRVVCEGQVEIA